MVVGCVCVLYVCVLYVCVLYVCVLLHVPSNNGLSNHDFLSRHTNEPGLARMTIQNFLALFLKKEPEVLFLGNDSFIRGEESILLET